jgi:hypothetical protein
MRGVAFVFMLAAVVCGTAGMIWGILMSVVFDHSLAPAHGHLNLVGWVTMALFGVYYRLTPAAARSRLALLHVGLAVPGLALFIPGLAIVMRGGTEVPVAAGSMMTVLSMAIFALTVIRHGFGERTGTASVGMTPQPA